MRFDSQSVLDVVDILAELNDKYMGGCIWIIVKVFTKLIWKDIKKGGYTRYLILWTYLFRKAQGTRNPFFKKIFRKIFIIFSWKHGIEISTSVHVGKGFTMGHRYYITLTPVDTVGENGTLQYGVLTDQGERVWGESVMVLGSNIWMGVNSSVMGAVTVGDDVLIAPNTFVNCDIPEHSVVFVNPCIIKHRDCATENYILSW